MICPLNVLLDPDEMVALAAPSVNVPAPDRVLNVELLPFRFRVAPLAIVRFDWVPNALAFPDCNVPAVTVV